MPIIDVPTLYAYNIMQFFFADQSYQVESAGPHLILPGKDVEFTI